MRITPRKRNQKGQRSKSQTDKWCSEFESLCRTRSIRVTPQRLAVYRTLAEDTTHPTADLVYSRLRRDFPGLSQATVYRTLEFLEKENLIRRVSAPEGVGRFDANISSHQHLVCRVCGSMSDISVPALERQLLPEVAGFTVEELDVRLVGSCHGCKDTKQRLKRSHRTQAHRLHNKR